MTDRSYPQPRPATEHGGSPAATAAPQACCGGPTPTGTDACCVEDAEVKSAGGTGCGCGSAPAPAAKKATACCA